MPADGEVRRCYYEVLEVTRTATVEEIKKSFRRKAKSLHPDTNPSPNAEAEFKELGEAYDVLSDANKRQVYDTYGHDGLKSGGYQPNYDFAQGFPDLSDIFSAFFGGGFASSRRSGGPQRGDDLRVDLTLAFEEAVFGCKHELRVNHLIGCTTCTGSGSAPGSGPSSCSTCGGHGQIRQTSQTILGQFMQIVTCPHCQGRGTVITNPCNDCQGQGRINEEKTLSVTVPAGVDHGTRLRVAGEGDVGPVGGPPGDLYVILNVRSHARFQRDGYHLYLKEKVSYPQLALGDVIEIPLLDGTHQLKIPAGTASGHVFQIKGAGVPQLNQPTRRGDQYVQVDIEIPASLSGEEKKLLSRLKEIRGSASAARAAQTAGKKSGDPSIMGRFREAFSGNV
ncbi:MAG: molecular chaperone DnaJ [Candidatus Melainabacteria bacterium]